MANTDQPVYLVANLVVKDLNDFIKRYGIDVVGQLQSIGAEVLAADTPEIVEGGGNINRTVIIRFPNNAVAKKWYESDEYAPFKQLRAKELTSEGTAMFVGAFDPSVLG